MHATCLAVHASIAVQMQGSLLRFASALAHCLATRSDPTYVAFVQKVLL